MSQAVVIAVSVFLSGCAAVPTKQAAVEICDGKETIAQAVAVLNEHRQTITAIQARGHCIIRWHDDKKKEHTEKPEVVLVFYPPGYLYFRGNVLGQEVIRLGSNAEEFWFRMKPREISHYQWGKRCDVARCNGLGRFNPDNLLEALGMVSVDEDWALSNQARYDVLTLFDGEKVRKRIHVDSCDYLVRKIEYFDADGNAAVTIELDGYTETSDGAVVATKINIINQEFDGMTVDINLKNVKPAKPFKAGLFQRPPSKGFEYVYQLNDYCQWIRQ